MNFSFTGPQFLGLYMFLAVAANGLYRYLLWRREARPVVSITFAQDPYRIAFLRGGADWAIRVAIFSLVDRGLLEESKGLVRRARNAMSASAHRPLEQAILHQATEWTALTLCAKQANVRAAADAYGPELEKLGLVAGVACLYGRKRLRQVFLWSLFSISTLRIANALVHGRQNFGFLIILTVVALVSLAVAGRNRLTRHGIATLERLRVLFARVQRNAVRLKPGGQTNDAVLLVAIFGFSDLPAAFQVRYMQFFQSPELAISGRGGSSSSNSGGGCGSVGCGGSGCGGGCGGGGCGG